MTVWFTGDEHFGHENIIDFCKRPYDSVRRMATSITGRLSKVVKPEDTVYHLGDLTLQDASEALSLKRIMQREFGTHILILGNHDLWKPDLYLEIGFRSVHTSLELELEGKKFVLAHDPAVSCAIPEDTFLLHGHIHILYKHLMRSKPPQRVINVGVDVWDFYPVSFQQILDLIRKEECNVHLP